MEFHFVVAPFLGFLVAGSLKFAINSIKARSFAFNKIGMGNMPSTHNTITASTASTIGFALGFDNAIFAVAVSLAFIVAIDSMDLRKQIERHALILSKELVPKNGDSSQLRLNVGHSVYEVTAGLTLGSGIGFCLVLFFGS